MGCELVLEPAFARTLPSLRKPLRRRAAGTRLIGPDAPGRLVRDTPFD